MSQDMQELRQRIQISAQPISNVSCTFTLSEPVYDGTYYFPRGKAEGSLLAQKLFELDDIVGVLISGADVTITKTGFEEWQTLGPGIGATLRLHVGSGEPAVDPSIKENMPSSKEIQQQVQAIITAEINPSIASHGGFVNLVDVKENNIYIHMGGGCQGCGQAGNTLQLGIEKTLREKVPGLGLVVDATNHAEGQNPYY